MNNQEDNMEVENVGYGWKCPECNHIYSPYIYQCHICNADIENNEE